MTMHETLLETLTKDGLGEERGKSNRRGYSKRNRATRAPFVLENLDAVDEGWNVYQSGIYRYQDDWERWYDGNFHSLFPEGTMSNGIKQLEKLNSLLQLNHFRYAADFMSDGVGADEPVPSGIDEETQEWLDEYIDMIDEARHRAIDYWAIFDYCVMMVSPTMVQAVNPKYYYRVGLPEQRDADVGHCVLLPYTDFTDSEALAQNAQDRVRWNRILVIKLDNNNMATQQRFFYNDGKIGKSIEAKKASDIVSIVTAGEGNSWFENARDVVAAMVVNDSMSLVGLNQFDNRIRILPALAVENAAAAAGLNVGDPMGLADLWRKLEEDLRPLITYPQGEQPPNLDTMQKPPTMERLAFGQHLAELFTMISRVTPSSYGYGIGRGESGAAREKAQDAAGIAVRRVRRQLARAQRLICVALGREVSWTWDTPPFQSKEMRQMQAREDYNAGFITADEVRAVNGYAPLSDEQRKELKLDEPENNEYNNNMMNPEEVSDDDRG